MEKPDLTHDTDSSTDDSQVGTTQPGTTGRYIVVFRDRALDKAIELLESAGLRLAVSPESGISALKEDEVGDADVIVYRRLGVAVVSCEPERFNRLAEAALDPSSPILAIEPEKVRRIIEDRESHPEAGRDLTSNLKHSTNHLPEGRSVPTRLINDLKFSDRLTLRIDERVSSAVFDESQATWGLQITNVVSSPFSGRGIRIAILDTGIDLSVDASGRVHYHPDFEGRTIVTETFVPGTKTAEDGNGHGTHCLGTACGPLRPEALPRYGIAYDAEIYVAKVADDTGYAPDAWIIAGIEWAISTGCQIISLSIGNPKGIGEPFSLVYENVARRALKSGLLIIAAAGNDSLRPVRVCAVNEPADCPSIMAVSALSQQLEVAAFSNGGININGGEVDIAAPGVSVYSSYTMPTGHTRRSGTSVAAPHVAGIAALYSEANGAVGMALWNLLIGNARQLPFLPQDIGAGLVQSPHK